MQKLLPLILFLTICLGQKLWAQDFLSSEERQWLKEHQNTIVVAPSPDYAPIEMFDEQGHFVGICADFLKLIEEKLDIKFKIVQLKSWSVILDQAKKYQVDFTPVAQRTKEREEFWDFGNPYIEFNTVIVTRLEAQDKMTLENLKGLKVGVTKGYAIISYLNEKYPEIKLVNNDNDRSSLHMVSKGELDAAILTVPMALYFSHKDGLTNLKISGDTGYIYHLGFAVRKDWPILKSILDKSIKTISLEEKNRIYETWMPLSYGKPYNWRLLFTIMGITSLGILLIGSWNWTLRRQVRRRTEELAKNYRELELAQEHRRKTEILFESIFEIIPYTASIIRLEDFRYIKINKVHTEFYGLKEEEIIGHNVFELIGEENKEEFLRVVGIIKEKKKFDNFQLSINTKRGKRDLLISLVLASVKGEDCLVILGNDITERLQMEKRLIEANEAKSVFLANMTHEMRTPLNSILGMIDILAEAPHALEQDEPLKIARNNGETLLNIISDILDLAKIEKGEMNIEAHPFKLTELVHEVKGLFSLRLSHKNIPLKVTIDEHLPEILVGDSLKLRQILINLIGNSIKFTEQGEIGLRIFMSSPGIISFIVEDTGIGMAPDKIPLLFNRFSQLDSSITKKYGGTGLGLCICKNLVELMKGTIICESEMNKGTRFTFTLPLLKSSLENSPSVAEAVHISPLELKARILLVEDSEDNVILIRKYLEKTSCSLDVAENGKEALKFFEEKDFDLVLMDLSMPIMDGVSATAAMRQKEREENLQATPIVALTAYALESEKEKAYKAGCDLYVTKPIKKQKLFEVIANFSKTGTAQVNT